MTCTKDSENDNKCEPFDTISQSQDRDVRTFSPATKPCLTKPTKTHSRKKSRNFISPGSSYAQSPRRQQAPKRTRRQQAPERTRRQTRITTLQNRTDSEPPILTQPLAALEFTSNPFHGTKDITNTIAELGISMFRMPSHRKEAVDRPLLLGMMVDHSSFDDDANSIRMSKSWEKRDVQGTAKSALKMGSERRASGEGGGTTVWSFLSGKDPTTIAVEEPREDSGSSADDSDSSVENTNPSFKREKVRRRLKWRIGSIQKRTITPKRRFRSDGSVAGESVGTKSVKSFHTFHSTETAIAGNKGRRKSSNSAALCRHRYAEMILEKRKKQQKYCTIDNEARKSSVIHRADNTSCKLRLPTVDELQATSQSTDLDVNRCYVLPSSKVERHSPSRARSLSCRPKRQSNELMPVALFSLTRLDLSAAPLKDKCGEGVPYGISPGQKFESPRGRDRRPRYATSFPTRSRESLSPDGTVSTAPLSTRSTSTLDTSNRDLISGSFVKALQLEGEPYTFKVIPPSPYEESLKDDDSDDAIVAMQSHEDFEGNRTIGLFLFDSTIGSGNNALQPSQTPGSIQSFSFSSEKSQYSVEKGWLGRPPLSKGKTPTVLQSKTGKSSSFVTHLPKPVRGYWKGGESSCAGENHDFLDACNKRMPTQSRHLSEDDSNGLDEEEPFGSLGEIVNVQDELARLHALSEHVGGGSAELEQKAKTTWKGKLYQKRLLSSKGKLSKKETKENCTVACPTEVNQVRYLQSEVHLCAIHELASQHLEHGEYAEALDVFEEILRGQMEMYGDQHSRIGKALQNIAIVHLRTRNYDQAIRVLKKTLEIRKRSLGPTHLDVAVSLAQLGIAYLELGHHKLAIASFKEALQIRRKLMGPKHLKVAKLLNNIGCSLFEINNLKSAMVAFTEALEIQRNMMRRSPTTTECDREQSDPNQVLLAIAATLCNIGSIMLSLGKYDESMVALEEALLLQQSVLGDEHPTVLWTLNSVEFVNGMRIQNRLSPNSNNSSLNFSSKHLEAMTTEDSMSFVVDGCGLPPVFKHMISLLPQFSSEKSSCGNIDASSAVAGSSPSNHDTSDGSNQNNKHDHLYLSQKMGQHRQQNTACTGKKGTNLHWI